MRNLLWAAVIGSTMGGAAAAQSSASYISGVSDRTSYEEWFAGLEGEYKTGVEFWVSHRSIPKEATCYASNVPAASEWMHGCLIAQQRFALLDARRKSDPEYRLGWNSVQSPEVQQAVRARQGLPASGITLPPAQLQAVPPTPTRDDFIAVCSQEVASAYQRGLIPSTGVAYQTQESCVSRHIQQAAQAAEDVREANLRAQAARDQAQEAFRRQEAEASLARAQLAAEQSPDNNCRKPAFAGGLIESFNNFDAFKQAGIKSIDIEHLTTTKWDSATMNVICHGTFVLSNGNALTGTLEMKPNIAGDMMTRWKRD